MKTLAGITSLEVTVSLGILMILTSLSVFSYKSFILQNQIDSRIKDYKSMILFAKFKALQKTHPVCLKPCSENDWGTCVQLLQGEQIVREWAWSHNQIKVTWTGLSSNHKLCFHQHVDKNTLNGHFLFQTALFDKTMCLNRFGRVKVV